MDTIALHSTPQNHYYPEVGIINTSPTHQKNNATATFGNLDQKDRVSISDEARVASRLDDKDVVQDHEKRDVARSGINQEVLTDEQLQEIQKLQKRDAEVKAHEQAHKAVAGQHAAGGPSYTYEIGPNGKRYAVGGEVPIDMSKEATPEETILKMQIVSRAALAPASPSSADRRIAARATMIEAQARRELQTEQSTTTEKQQPVSDQKPDTPDSTNTNELDGEQGTTSSPLITSTRRMVLRAYQNQTM